MVNQVLADIVRAAIPGADEGDVMHVLWGRTAFPFKPVSARDIYKAASSLQRATAKGMRLCDWCHRAARPDCYTCTVCAAAVDISGVKV